MESFSLSGISFYVNGPHTPVRHAIEEMFHYCRNAYDSKSIPFNIFEFDESELSAFQKTVPMWLNQYFQQIKPSEEVWMVYENPDKHDGDFASVLVNDFLICCSYYSVSLNELFYIIYRKNRLKTPLSVSSVIIPVFAELFSMNNKLLLHAASILSGSDKGLMIVADSGCGKTTTALSILRNNGRMLCDDLTILSVTSDSIEMIGIPEKMNITDNTIDYFGELHHIKNSQKDKTYSQKYIVSAGKIYGDQCMIGKCMLDIIYFVEISENGPLIEPLGVPQAFGKLIKAKTFARNQIQRPGSPDILFSILTQTRFYTLKTGTDPVLLGGWIAKYCHHHA